LPGCRCWTTRIHRGEGCLTCRGDPTRSPARLIACHPGTSEHPLRPSLEQMLQATLNPEFWDGLRCGYPRTLLAGQGEAVNREHVPGPA